MRPGDKFSLVNSKQISFDPKTFTKLYLPIIGQSAFALYQLLMITPEGKFSALMEHLNIGQNRLSEAFDKLMGLSLLRLFDRHLDYQIVLQSPLNYEAFMADTLLRQLLVAKIGEEKVSAYLPIKPEGSEVTKKFSEVYNLDYPAAANQKDTEIQEAGLKKGDFLSNQLDLDNFKALMAKEDYHFANENVDVLHLYSISEKFSLDWYALFKLAEETANADRTINTYAMTRKLVANDEKQPEVSADYRQLIQVAKEVEPKAFLTQLKHQVGGFVTRDEETLLANFSKQKISTEVQNILIHYTIVQQKHANLTAVFVNRIANDWLRNKVDSAERAIERIQEYAETAKKPKKTTTKKNVKKQPAWSNPDYKNETSQEDLAKLQELQRETLAKIGGSDGTNRK